MSCLPNLVTAIFFKFKVIHLEIYHAANVQTKINKLTSIVARSRKVLFENIFTFFNQIHGSFKVPLRNTDIEVLRELLDPVSV